MYLSSSYKHCLIDDNNIFKPITAKDTNDLNKICKDFEKRISKSQRLCPSSTLCCKKTTWKILHFFFKLIYKEILHEIGFMEEMRNTEGNKEVPQTIFHNYPYLQKYVLIRLTPYHWQSCILQFCNITKGVL